ncbi:MAG TPA: hypothetical protein VLI05_04125 [Candidatus Saccharimonadia bacterium]|nr:hypothetical protein [Candidatus Saccharimonadia bacterium]
MKNGFVEHYIQREILRVLSQAAGLRFSELKPDGLSNNIFMYHLKQLMRQGLVVKAEDIYQLSDEGLRYVDQVTRTNLDHRPSPKLTSLLVIENDLGEHVLWRRYAQPFINRLALPAGRIFFGEEPEYGAGFELVEHIGLQVPLQRRGLVSVQLGEQGAAVTHIHAHILHGRVQGRPALSSFDPRFSPQWVSVAGVAANDLLPGVTEIIDRAAKAQSDFFLNLQYLKQGEPSD